MEKNKRKIFISGKATRYAYFIDGARVVNRIEDADIVIFTGGADINPDFYGEPHHPRTGIDSRRDLEDFNNFETANKLNKLCLGICRGSQFLTVMAGGKLVQDCDNHGVHGTHPIKFNDGSIMEITSTHHQMMYPYNLDESNYDMIAVSHPSRSSFLSNGHLEDYKISDPDIKEPEIVYYNKINSLCIQGHPEQMRVNAPIIAKINELIIQYM